MRVVASLNRCHTLRASTLACLRRLFQQALPPETALEVYLVDDGSTDGTEDGIRAAHPSVHVIPGDASLDWCDGMSLAWSRASKADPDSCFWLDYDTVLYHGAINSLLTTADHLAGKPCIVVRVLSRRRNRQAHEWRRKLRSCHPGQTAPLVPADAATRPCNTKAPMDAVNRRFTSSSVGVRRVRDATIVPVHV